jgi:pimeloyl-ACP methyl ester carboxylesterase
VLVHGVGFGPGTLAPLAAELERHAPVIVFTRRGYGDRARLPPARTVAEHVDDVVRELDDAGVARAVIAGMSGGATVALALALSHRERTITAIVHEPAAGSVAPELRSFVRESLDRGGGAGLLRALAGPTTWARLPADVVRELDASHALVEQDARAFLAFEPALATAPLVCSVGEHSSPLRFEVARRLAARTGAPVSVVEGCGHLPQLDAPQAFARLILDHAPVSTA